MYKPYITQLYSKVGRAQLQRDFPLPGACGTENSLLEGRLRRPKFPSQNPEFPSQTTRKPGRLKKNYTSPVLNGESVDLC